MPFDFKPLSPKAWDFVVNSTARINLASGAVRSGKTVGSIIRWIELVKSVPDHYNLLMVGKTERTLKRNIIDVLIDMVGTKNCYLKIGSGELILYGKTIYIVGANDEKSQDKIRGMTLYAAYCDEVSLYPESFFTMLLSRLSMEGSMLFATTNPDSPKHWLKANYIDNCDELNMKYWHFEITDNNTLPEQYVEDLKKEYRGVWYKRFIEGKWVVAEGSVYPGWDEYKYVVDTSEMHFKYHIVGIDYGTTNPTCFLLIGFNNPFDTKYVLKEYYWDSKVMKKQKTDSEYADDLVQFINGYRVGNIYVDPSAASFQVELRKRGIIPKPGDNDVLSGIRFLDSEINKGKIVIDKSCVNLLNELPAYAWDDEYTARHGEDKPIKDNDHACLVGSTLVDTIDGPIPIKDLVGKTGYVYSFDGEQMVIKPFDSAQMTRKDADIVVVEVEDGRKVRCTKDHRLLTTRGKLEAQEITTDDYIVDIRDAAINCGFPEYAKVTSIYEDGKEDVYNMYVEDTHLYSVSNGLVSRNCDSARYALFTHFGSGPAGILMGMNYN